jgi:hypothetical protein
MATFPFCFLPPAEKKAKLIVSPLPSMKTARRAAQPKAPKIGQHERGEFFGDRRSRALYGSDAAGGFGAT